MIDLRLGVGLGLGGKSSMASRSHSESDISFPNSTSTYSGGLADPCIAKCMEVATDITGSKSPYKGIVKSVEMQVTKLTGEMCRTNNYLALTESGPTADRAASPAAGVNAAFCVLTEHAACYTGRLHTRVPLELFPLSSCPDRARHVGDVQTLPLPMACPTCWSLQRLPAPRTPDRRHQGSGGRGSKTPVEPR